MRNEDRNPNAFKRKVQTSETLKKSVAAQCRRETRSIVVVRLLCKDHDGRTGDELRNRLSSFLSIKMAFVGQKSASTALQFLKHYVQQAQASRMYQTIRVIRPKPKTPPSYFQVLKDMPPKKLVVFAIASGVGGSSLMYIMYNSGLLETLGTISFLKTINVNQMVLSSEPLNLSLELKQSYFHL